MFLEFILFNRSKAAARSAFVIILAAALLFAAGCVSGAADSDNLAKAREAVSAQNYKQATRYVRSVLKSDPGNREAGSILTYLPYKDNILLAAYWENDDEAVRYIAPIVHDINRADPRFNAPVIVLAAAWGQTDMVEILLEAGADPNYGTDKDGYTALMWACKNFDEQLDMVRILLEAGADMNAKSNYNETALSIAEEYQNHNIVLLLHEYGMPGSQTEQDSYERKD